LNLTNKLIVEIGIVGNVIHNKIINEALFHLIQINLLILIILNILTK